MSKITSVLLVLGMCLLAHYGSARPAISQKTLGTKLTPTITLVFQSLHNAIDVSEQKADKATKQRPKEVLAIVVKDTQETAGSQSQATPFQQTNPDWVEMHPSGIFGDAESGRMPSVMLPVSVI